MNLQTVIICTSLITYAVCIVILAYSIGRLWVEREKTSHVIHGITAQIEAWQRAQFSVNEEFRQRSAELYSAIEVAISRVRLELSDHLAKFSDITDARRKATEDSIHRIAAALDQLGNLSDERAETAKQAAIDIDVRFQEVEKTLKIKRVEVGNQNQSRSKPWSEVRKAAGAGEARIRFDAEQQSEQPAPR